jgi:hypothetical protein
MNKATASSYIGHYKKLHHATQLHLAHRPAIVTVACVLFFSLSDKCITTYNYAMTTSFHILSNSLFTKLCYPVKLYTELWMLINDIQKETATVVSEKHTSSSSSSPLKFINQIHRFINHSQFKLYKYIIYELNYIKISEFIEK